MAGSGTAPAGVARAMLHKHGHSSSQVPIGRSHRASWLYGTTHSGRSRLNYTCKSGGERAGEIVRDATKLGRSKQSVLDGMRPRRPARLTQLSLTISVKLVPAEVAVPLVIGSASARNGASLRREAWCRWVVSCQCCSSPVHPARGLAAASLSTQRHRGPRGLAPPSMRRREPKRGKEKREREERRTNSH